MQFMFSHNGLLEIGIINKVHVCADEQLRQLGRVRKERIFLLLFTVTALLCGALL